MKTITIELRDEYADAIIFTCIGHSGFTSNISVDTVMVKDGMVIRQERDNMGQIRFKEK